MKKIFTLDTTLRDGMQGKGISFTAADKLKIVKRLDDFGIDFIEAGMPSSSPKEAEFFEALKDIRLNHARLCAFGQTVGVNESAEGSFGLKQLAEVACPYITLFGKASAFHVNEVLRCEREENLRMIKDSITYLIKNKKRVIFDAEHFFDGYVFDKEYALECIACAKNAGAEFITLCDTNGGSLPEIIEMGVKDAISTVGENVAIHCHNDMGIAVFNSMSAVNAGANMVQGCICGLGERCGNTDILTLIANLQLKCGYKLVDSNNLDKMYNLVRFVAEISNIHLPSNLPYVGSAAFTHKAGTHIDAVEKNPKTFEHINPEIVGNSRSLVISEASGRGAMKQRINQIVKTEKNSALTARILEKIKALENDGYQFEGADASLELIIRKEAEIYHSAFELKEFKVMANEPAVTKNNSYAMLNVTVDGATEIAAADGEGPVDALDKALRRALSRFYPQLSDMSLTDYKVRVLDSDKATAAKVRVLIESTDGNRTWSTIGVSTDIIHASWLALVDSVDYMLIETV